jgi:hypothetical protein
MSDDVKKLQSEDVRYKARMAAGAWLDGQSLSETGSATMPKANSDHGNDLDNKSAIAKDNA